MKKFIKKIMIKQVWTFTLTLFSVFAALSLLAGCGQRSPWHNRAYPPGSHFPGGYSPQGGWHHNSLYLSSFESISIRDTEAYGRFLEEVMHLCRQNRFNGVYGEWHGGGSFGSPISSCGWATQNYNRFAIDLSMDINPQQNSPVDMEFFVGYDSGFYGTQWIPSSSTQWMSLVGELKHEEDGDFRIVYRPVGNNQPRITIYVDGSIEDLQDDRRDLSVTIKYGGDRIGRGKISIVDPFDNYDYPYYSHYDPYSYH